MGNCCSTFRAVFKPNEGSGGGIPLMPVRGGSTRRPDSLPKPPAAVVPSPPSLGDVPDAGVAPEVASVKEVDVLLAENGDAHRTRQYELMDREKEPRLVVRRGQPFAVSVTLSRPYNPDIDAISFVFTVEDAEKPSYGQGTLVAVPLLAKGAESGAAWNAVLDSSADDILRIQITPAADAIVGKWKMDIDTKLKNDGAVSYSYKDPFYILYNPWCRQDQVFLEGEELLQEYVLNDTGLIWRGSYNRLRPCVWKYAQFEKDILDCALYLVSKIGGVRPSECGDPVRVCRAISAAVNSPDDNGAVMGNWSNDYGGGTPPTKWIGSMKILQQFYKNKKPVKYGQCWVFAGVLTTVCRTLGLPARTVTTYSAAHDTQNSLTVDYFVDDKGEIMEEMNSDSIWNFHVWTEVWMERPDLMPGDGAHYGGWQAVDSTPQELSDNMYRCGPAPVVAVKQGEVLRPYDSGYVFAEVNADKVFWHYSGPTQPLKLIRKDMLGIGQNISTKAVGRFQREDITNTYKYPEKSVEERAAMLKALRQSESLFSRYYLNEDFNDIHFNFELRDDIVIGSPFSVVVVMKNRSNQQDYTVTVLLRVDTVLYTGHVKDGVKKEKAERVIKAGAVEEVRIDVSYEDYYKHLVDQCAFNIACLATVHDTKYEYFAQDDFRVRKPDIKIKLEGEPVQGQEMSAVATLKNPLPIPVKKGQFLIEGPGIAKTQKIKLSQNIAPGEEASVNFKFTPKYDGRATIAAKFTSKELDDVDGFLNFMVEPKKEVNGTGNAA
ncbi:annulin isoform X1 [Schistocerca nitens]|uniref:annulin isoform X1 n=1 Tax=Schistocerca nitens TaxID=7011 RepID=UPI002118EE87|nr:annulin isoform X1 [Schistocerca nitens]